MKVFLFVILGTLISFHIKYDVFGYLSQDVAFGKKYYYQSLKLNHERVELKSQVTSLKFEVEKLQNKLQYFELKHNEAVGKGDRTIASIKSVDRFSKSSKDYVKFPVYQWSDFKLFSIADKEFSSGNYEKAAQFYITLIEQYPKSQYIDDHTLYQAGLSCYRTEKYYEDSIGIFSLIIEKYPESPVFLRAKLWRGLSYYHTSQTGEFQKVIEEFRKKYRNTDEWKMLSQYYEGISSKFDL